MKFALTAHVSALTLTNYFLRHFTGKNIAVIEQRKAFWELCLNIRLISQRDVTKFRVANFCSEYNFPGTQSSRFVRNSENR